MSKRSRSRSDADSSSSDFSLPIPVDTELPAKRRRTVDNAEEKMLKTQLGASHVIPAGDRFLFGSSGYCIWRPSLCKNPALRKYLEEEVFAWSYDAPDLSTEYARSYLNSRSALLTRHQLAQLPPLLRDTPFHEIGVLDLAHFPVFTVNEDAIVQAGRL